MTRAMPENAIIPDAIIPDGNIPAIGAVSETAKEKLERERLSRRQALKKFGMTSAMATFALFSVDDLARMVGKAMQQRAGDNKISERLAEEFQNTGVTQAAYGVDGIILNCRNYGVNCAACCTTVNNVCTGLGNDYITCNAAQLNCLTTCLQTADPSSPSSNG